ncbi:MAG: hypothetical protein CMH81_00525 [Nitrospiraceae bacterium]|nr:hypothetical protein [Nitrospiraceae bacterium]|tara:strand:- start:33 stop:500 length:468 start_codon:yes stop_codon:yes gene_type:complete
MLRSILYDRESELLRQVWEVGERQANLLVFAAIMQLEALGVAQDERLEKFVILKTEKADEYLSFEFSEITSNARLFDQQHTFPVQIDETTFITRLFGGIPGGSTTAKWRSANRKETLAEKLCLPFSITLPNPFSDETFRPGFTFVPRKPRSIPLA